MGRRLRFLPYDETLVEVTNRTIHSRFLLKPTKRFRLITLGALGRAQRRYGVRIHAFVFLSNHYHLLISVRDVQQMARFVGYFESKLAKEIARSIGWRDKIWARRYTAIPVSHEEAAQIGRLDYVLSHGVKEGLVPHPADWPGAQSVDALLRGTPLQGTWYDRTAEHQATLQGRPRPQEQFAKSESIALSPLPCWAHESTETIRQRVQEMVSAIVEAARAEPGRLRKILSSLRPTDRPERSKRAPAPWFHCASKTVRRELKRAYRVFLLAYREATQLWWREQLTAPFPEGGFLPVRPASAS